MKTIDKYLFQALDNYPYSLEEVAESLEYALSVDSKNTMALCLTGRIYAEQLLNYDVAISYFQEALSHNIYALEIYPHYINTLILNEDFEEVQKLIDFALTIKGINKTEILLKKVLLYETKQEFEQCKNILKQVRLSNCASENNLVIEECEKRIDEKVKLLSKKGKKKKKTK